MSWWPQDLFAAAAFTTPSVTLNELFWEKCLINPKAAASFAKAVVATVSLVPFRATMLKEQSHHHLSLAWMLGGRVQHVLRDF